MDVLDQIKKLLSEAELKKSGKPVVDYRSRRINEYKIKVDKIKR